MSDWSEELAQQMQKDMAEEVRDLLGPGYVPDYYAGLASGFVMVAEHFARGVLAEQRP